MLRLYLYVRYFVKVTKIADFFIFFCDLPMYVHTLVSLSSQFN